MSNKHKKRPAYASPAPAPKASAKKEPVAIKKKPKKMPTGAIIGILIAIILIAGIVLYIALANGWFPEKDDRIPGTYKVTDYSTIELDKSEVEMSKEDLEQTLNSYLAQDEIKTPKTEGVIEDGDEVITDYVGMLTDTGEVFEGGSAENATVRIGSGQYIDGFESGLIGAPVKGNKTIDVTFPKDYQNEKLAGQKARFTFTIKSVNQITTPEATDDWAQTYSKENLSTPVASLDELKKQIQNDYKEKRIQTLIPQEMNKRLTVTAYDETIKNELKAFYQKSVETNASAQNITTEEYAKQFGYDSADAYLEAITKEDMDAMMWTDQVLRDKNITWTGAEFNKALENYANQTNTNSTPVNIQVYKAQVDPTWLFIYKNLDFKQNLAIDALKDNIKLVDLKDSETEIKITEPENK